MLIPTALGSPMTMVSGGRAARCRSRLMTGSYTEAGITLDDLIRADLRPRTLFEGSADHHDRLMTALDEVNSRFRQ